ncbi:hypothetical protein ACT3TE_18590 [Brachybacterium sp. AOP42-B2-9]|uniref:hypothetical protein n=1 Tax=Brachybacterium sp. AOP42-B2-9 TaxID=3457672 RepID=UPI004034D582
MSERIVGKVAKVNSDRELIINRGHDAGVEPGDYFYIMGDPVEITDPDNGETLGEMTPIKAVVRVREVGTRFCIARTYRTRKVKVADAKEGSSYMQSIMNPLGGLLQPPTPEKYETRVDTFRVDPQEGVHIDESESVVSIGDIAQSLVEGESLDPATATLYL